MSAGVPCDQERYRRVPRLTPPDWYPRLNPPRRSCCRTNSFTKGRSGGPTTVRRTHPVSRRGEDPPWLPGGARRPRCRPARCPNPLAGGCPTGLAGIVWQRGLRQQPGRVQARLRLLRLRQRQLPLPPTGHVLGRDGSRPDHAAPTTTIAPTTPRHRLRPPDRPRRRSQRPRPPRPPRRPPPPRRPTRGPARRASSIAPRPRRTTATGPTGTLLARHASAT